MKQRKHTTHESRGGPKCGVFHGRKPSLRDPPASVLGIHPPPLKQTLPNGSVMARVVHGDAAWTRSPGQRPRGARLPALAS